jgi:NADPH-dependent FMN reductase
MSDRKISAVVGSFRKDSINRMLARAVLKLMPRDFDSQMVRIDDLPVYNQDLDATSPDALARLKAEIAAVNGLIFVTPRRVRRPVRLRRSQARPMEGAGAWPDSGRYFGDRRPINWIHRRLDADPLILGLEPGPDI